MMQFMAIRQQLLAQIDRGLLAPGKKLPGERQLAETFSTTRVTLREALAVLEAEGRLYRRERRGWFVAPTPCAYDPNQLMDWQQYFSPYGGQFYWMTQKTQMADAMISDQMQLPPFGQVFEGEGIVSVEQLPVGFVRTFLHPEFFPTIWDAGDKATLADPAMVASESHWSSAWEALEEKRSKALEVAAGTPALMLRRYWRIHQASGWRTIRIDQEWWRQHAVSLCGGSAYETRR
ncbi:GntR family transcriptional regulator [Salinivibrio sp. ES.052]|uniref:GntR family transcriptional regulator n=1 Tax=Salinivibrio sp. ES.052 TaxID=1882823 RepID=UPI00092C9E1B|nr:GntR family transcriptional regulator [Salinivibrio sp. ES.052]SIO34628.1 transcriptional regulator, GntR family [Salinivibrio sp. ES.052]